MSNEPQDPFSALAEGAAQVHELYLAWLGAGFAPDQAIYLVATILAASMRAGPPPQP